MARPLGLTLRGGSYQLRIVIPKDLRDVYEGRSDIRISLGKLDRALAYPLAHRLRAEKEAEFAQRRLELNPHKVTEVTPNYRRPLHPRSMPWCCGKTMQPGTSQRFAQP